MTSDGSVTQSSSSAVQSENRSMSAGTSCRWCFFFFFQAEDGIRDSSVTGVQTCALPISRFHAPGDRFHELIVWNRVEVFAQVRVYHVRVSVTQRSVHSLHGVARAAALSVEIGRASCRERV